MSDGTGGEPGTERWAPFAPSLQASTIGWVETHDDGDRNGNDNENKDDDGSARVRRGKAKSGGRITGSGKRKATKTKNKKKGKTQPKANKTKKTTNEAKRQKRTNNSNSSHRTHTTSNSRSRSDSQTRQSSFLSNGRPSKRKHPRDTEQDLPQMRVDATVSLPDHVTVRWDGSNARISTPKESTLYVAGRFTIQLVRGQASTFGFALSISDDYGKGTGKGSAVCINSPPWSPAMNIDLQGGKGDTETEIVLHSVGDHPTTDAPTFHFVGDGVTDTSNETSRVQIPSCWTKAAQQIQEEAGSSANTTNTDNHKNVHRTTPQNDPEEKQTSPSQRKTARVLVCGAKGTGKSSCVRYTLNSLLSTVPSVAVLDCDVGQPEFSPPGMLSLTLCNGPLLSQPHNHMAACGRDDRLAAYFFGLNSPKGDPAQYLSTIQKLLDVYETVAAGNDTDRNQYSEVQRIPLLVNTGGWVKGLGSDLLNTIVGMVQPTQVLSLGNVAVSPPNGCRLSEFLSTTHRLEACGLQATHKKLSPAVWRALRIIQYFAPVCCSALCLQSPSSSWWSEDQIDVLQNNVEDNIHKVGQALAVATPYAVPLDDVYITTRASICQQGATNGNLSVLDVLEGSIVALCTDALDKSSPCVGLGLVRSIDRQKRILYLITPLDSASIRGVEELVVGEVDSPPLMHFAGINGTSFAYLDFGGVLSSGLGGNEMKSRSNILRTSRPQ